MEHVFFPIKISTVYQIKLYVSCDAHSGRVSVCLRWSGSSSRWWRGGSRGITSRPRPAPCQAPPTSVPPRATSSIMMPSGAVCGTLWVHLISGNLCFPLPIRSISLKSNKCPARSPLSRRFKGLFHLRAPCPHLVRLWVKGHWRSRRDPDAHVCFGPSLGLKELVYSWNIFHFAASQSLSTEICSGVFACSCARMCTLTNEDALLLFYTDLQAYRECLHTPSDRCSFSLHGSSSLNVLRSGDH